MAGLIYEAAHSLLKHFVKFTSTDYDALGITEQMMLLTTSEQPWRRDQLPTVMRTLLALIHGSLEIHGLPKTTIPAEYVAMVLVCTVRPGNMRNACAWLADERQSGAPIADLARGSETAAITHVSQGQLFALVALLWSTPAANRARQDMVRIFELQTLQLEDGNAQRQEEDDDRQTTPRKKTR